MSKEGDKVIGKGKYIKMSKRAQLTVYVIIAIAIVAGIAALLIATNRFPAIPIGKEPVPENFIGSCVEKNINDAIEIMLPQGGFIAPSDYKIYDDKRVAYLCKHEGYYQPCINQHPVLITEMKAEVLDYSYPKISECFEEMKKALESRQSKVEMSEMKESDVMIDFLPGKIRVDINRTVKITKTDATRTIDGFKINIENPVYDIANVANEIASQEAKYCYFEYVGFMLLYPRFDIRKFAMSDPTKIYTIKDKSYSVPMNIAIRSCAIPPGF